MNKRNLIFLSMMVVVVTIIFTIGKQQIITIDETMLNINQLVEGENIITTWILVENTLENEAYGELSAGRNIWTLDGELSSFPDLIQTSLIYNNDVFAMGAFYWFAPNRVFKHDVPNFDSSTSNYLKEANIELNANRHRIYCGLGTIKSCQVWYYWAQYEHILVSLRLFLVGGIGTFEDFESIIYELDTQLSDLIIE